MANLSNINGKFVVEQTTGFVGIGTTDPDFLIEAAGTNAELALNASSIYRVRSTASDEFIITKNGVGDRLTIAGGGNATFSGEITSGDDINCPTKIVVGESATAEVRLKKTNAGYAKVSFYNNSGSSSESSYIRLDSSEDMQYYGDTGVNQLFYSNDTLALTLSGAEATFAGALNIDQYIYHTGDTDTYIRVLSDEWIFRTGGSDRFTISSANTYFSNTSVGIGTSTPQKALHIEGASGASASQLLVCGPSDTTGDTAGILLRAEGGEGDSALRAKGGIFFERNATGNGLGSLHFCNNPSNNNDSADLTDSHMTILGNGNVGIGKTDPATKLQVANAGEVIVRSSMTASDGYRGGFEADNQHTGGTIWSMFSTNDSDGYFGGGKFVIANESMGGVDANTTGKFIIDGSGNVTIDNTVSGDAKLTLVTTTGGDPTIIMNSDAANRSGVIKYQDAGTNIGRIQYDHSVDRIDIQAGSATGATMSIKNGTVGIGTTAPTTALSVSDGASMYANSNYLVQIKRDATNSDDNTSKASILLANNSNAFQIAYGGATDRLRFINGGGTEQMTLLNGGNIGINDTSAPNTLSVKDASSGNLVTRWTGGSTFSLYQNNTDGTVIFSANHGGGGSENRFIWQTNAGTAKMKLDSGTLTVSGDLVAYGSPSDKRLKENIKPIKSALDKVSKLQGVTFNWKESGSILELKEDVGFIAQDVQKVMPELVRENKDGMLSMRHQGIAPILLEAIKELKAEIEELKKHSCDCKE